MSFLRLRVGLYFGNHSILLGQFFLIGLFFELVLDFCQLFHFYLSDVLNDLLEFLLEVVLDLVEAGLEASPDFLDLVLHALLILLKLFLIEEARDLRLHVKVLQVDIVARLSLV